MIGRSEWLYLREKIRRIENSIFEFENAGETYRAYEDWLDLTEKQKAELDRAWDVYYEEVKKSPPYENYLKMKKAFDAGDSEGISRYHGVAKRQLASGNWIKKPSLIDPSTFAQKLSGYFEAKRKLTEIRSVVDEFAPVYGAKTK